ncbi:class I SAM-dependent methyltransferase [Candidatus Parcubacteria bacterium]|nr:class I SAM-dependent methyltransferase [Candidatus Parcubacteria bacterium]
MTKTRERIIPREFRTKEEYLIFLRHSFEYQSAIEKLTADNLVIEIGCGEGYGTSLLSKNVKRIIGIDIDQNTIKHASDKYASENCVFQQFNGTKIPHNSNSFDVAVSFHVIEHVRDDYNFISEIYRVLKSGGILIISTPNKKPRTGRRGRLLNEFHVREYYFNELNEILQRTFSNIKIMGVFGNQEVQKIEIERVKLISRILSYDFFNIAKFIPQSLKTLILKLLKYTINQNKKTKNINFLNKFSIRDYHLTENDIDNSLDFLAICKK